MEPLTVHNRIRDFLRGQDTYVMYFFLIIAFGILSLFFISDPDTWDTVYTLTLAFLFPVLVTLLLGVGGMGALSFLKSIEKCFEKQLEIKPGFLKVLLSLLVSLIIVIIVGLVLWKGAALLSSAPWWVALIIGLLSILLFSKKRQR